MNLRSARILVLLLVVGSVGFGCKWNLRRPVGYFRAGSVAELMGTETFRPVERLFIRHDERGFSAMSTECTYDLSPLRLEGDRFISSFSTSTYSKDGRVLTGPATANLPYYEVVVKQSKPGGPKDAVFVLAGEERPPEWRMPAPVN